MKLLELDKSSFALNYWANEDKNTLQIFLDAKTNLEGVFLDPFKEELNCNLLSKNTKEEREVILRHYLFKLSVIDEVYKQYNYILKEGYLISYSDVHYEHENEEEETKTLDSFEIYVVRSYELYRQLFDEIQKSCIVCKIDFDAICKDLELTFEYIDKINSLSLENYEKKSCVDEIEYQNKIQEIDPLRLSLHEWGVKLKGNLNEADLEKLEHALYIYLKDGIFPEIGDVITLTGKINKKWFGWAINELLISHGKNLTIDVLVFANQKISKFLDYELDEKNYTKGNLYKCFKTRVIANH